MYRIVLNETSYFGAGCRSVIAEEVKKRGYKKAFFVTDKDKLFCFHSCGSAAGDELCQLFRLVNQIEVAAKL